jgi:hypothetical protein
VLLLAGLTGAAVLFARQRQRKTTIAKVSLPVAAVSGPYHQATGNPLLQSLPPPKPAQQSTWRAHSEGADNWFVNTATSEVSWVLPPGAVVVA